MHFKDKQLCHFHLLFSVFFFVFFVVVVGFCFASLVLSFLLASTLEQRAGQQWLRKTVDIDHRSWGSLKTIFLLYTVELQWLERLWNHGNIFETGVVRVNEC